MYTSVSVKYNLQCTVQYVCTKKMFTVYKKQQTEEKAKGRRCCLGDGIECRTSQLASRTI